MRFIAWIFVVFTLTASAASADPRYLDDRSSPEALIRSLYNAINRHEYARAWDYFETQPAKDFATYVKGFEGTASVKLVTGIETGDGAAGSIFFNMPVAIAARNSDGQEKFFSGCYTVRQSNVPVEEPPFSPLRIFKASLKPSKQHSLAGSLPKDC